MLSTLTITINNQSFSLKPSQLFDKFGWYVFDREEQRSNLSTTISYPDQALTYDQTVGLITSEFASYGSSVDHISRGSYPIVFDTPINTQGNPVILPNGSGTARFTVTINEPLMIDPLVFDHKWWRKPGMTMIQNFMINMTFDPVMMQRLWRQASNDLVDYDSISVTIQQPVLSLIYYTAPNYLPLPKLLSYPFTTVQNYVYTNNNPVTPAIQSFVMTSNSMQFNSIPHRIYVSVSKNFNSKTHRDTDSFCPITSVNIVFNNTSGILSTLTQQDLYLICQKNGLRQSYAAFSGQPIYYFEQNLTNGQAQTRTFIGPSAPIALEFGSDIPLLNGQYPGQPGVFNFQISVNVINNRPEPSWIPQMDIIIMYHGYMTIANGSVTLNTGLNTPGGNFDELPRTNYPTDNNFLLGGKFDLGSILGNIVGMVAEPIGNLFRGLFGGPSSSSGVMGTQASPGITQHPEAAYTKAPRKSAISRQIELPELED
jgi:hypothetical protein